MEKEFEHELDHVRFRVMSADEIKKRAVCEIMYPRTSGVSSLGDLRLGPVLPLQKCVVCQKMANGTDSCVGHFGYIVLNEPIAHPLLLKYIVLYLKAFCTYCHQLVFPFTFTAGPENSHIKHIINNNSYDVCVHCTRMQPQYSASVSDGAVYMVTPKSMSGTNRKLKRAMTARELLDMFSSIPEYELAKLGPQATDPRNFILTVLPVLPCRARPALMSETLVSEDDLTIQYMEIIKINNHLADTTLTLTRRAKYVHMLSFRIKSLFDNSNQKSRHTNNRALKGLKERIAGKSGVIRCNLMGKRSNMSGRTVLGPDVNIPTGWVTVPKKIAQILTVPERVNDVNVQELQALVRDGKAPFMIREKDGARINLKYATVKAGTPLMPHDTIFRAGGKRKINVGLEPKKHHVFAGDRVVRAGEDITSQLTMSEHRAVELATGDVVERYLRDGDTILLNRQPTLHSGSMIGLYAKICEGNTIRIPLSITRQLGADFDGDEVSTFVPIDITARAELETLSGVEGNFFCAQGSTTYASIVQDGLLGMYLLTKEYGDREMPVHVFTQLAVRMYTFSVGTYTKMIARLPDGQKYTGRALVSMALPPDLTYEESGVCIKRGLLLSGCLTKTHLNGGTRSLIFVIGKYYSPRTALAFVDDMQFLANAFLEWRGFTVGIKDCKPEFEREELERILCEGLFTASQLENYQGDVPDAVRERYIGMALSQTRDVGMKLAADCRNSENNFVHTVTSGSKGAFFNIAQITTLLGQQVLKGTRMIPQLQGARTLVHYAPANKKPGLSMDARFESRGFVRNSFLHGLNPREFFFHTVAGREGIIDTSMKTSTSGYSQRKIVKFMEDIRVAHDGSVRDESNHIVQHKYAYTGLDPKKTVTVNGEQTFAEIKYLLEQCKVN